MSARRPLAALLFALAAVTAAAASTDPQGTGSAIVLRSVTTSGLEARAAALILSGQESGDLDASLLPIPLPAGEGRSRVALVVEIGAESLLEDREEGVVLAEVYAYLLDASGSVAAHLTEGFLLDPALHYETVVTEGLRYVGQLEVAPGSYSLRVLVLRRQTGRFSLMVESLDVPSWDGSEPVALPPFASSTASGVVVQQAGANDSAGEPSLLRASAARTDFGPGEAVELLLAARGLAQPPVGRVLDGDRREVASFPWRLAEPGGASPPTDLYRGELAPGLEPGAYELETTDASGATLAATLAFNISAPASAEALDSLAGITPNDLSEDAVATYLAGLGALAAGDRAAAVREISALQLAALEDGGPQGHHELLDTLFSVASRLAAGDVERLVPLIDLHDEMYRRFHRERRYLLATHSRSLLHHLAEMYAERSTSQQASQVLACTGVSRAAYLLQVGSLVRAEGSFKAALGYSPDHEAALLGWATVREAYGDYDEASRLLQRLVEVWPDNDEGKLRLAINLQRQGATRRAARLLRSLTEPSVEPWVAIVAHQELADLLLEGRGAPEAAKLLRSAIDRWPHVERFYIQLSAVLDRLGRPIEARAAIERLSSAPHTEGDSARFRYARWPHRLLHRDRRFLEEAAAERRASLAEALTGLPVKGS